MRVSGGELRVRDLWLMVRIAALAVAVRPLLALMSLPALLRLLDPGVRPGRNPSPAGLERPIQLARRVLSRAHGPFRQSCLRRSLALFRILRAAGFPVSIVFGLARPGDALDGHAWLELDGVSVGEPNGGQTPYKPIYRFPPSVLPPSPTPKG